MPLAKQVINQRYVYKIHSSRFEMNDWCLNLTIEEAKRNEEIVPIGDSTLLRMIRKIRNNDLSETNITNLKSAIKKIKSEKVTEENKQKIKEMYQRLDKMMLIDDYLAIIFDNKKDWKRANSKKQSIFFNGCQYVRLVGTNGGIKKNTVIFCKKDIYNELNNKLNNGRNINKEYVPAKFESYKALTCSVSTPVRNPKGVIVIKDAETIFKENILKLSDDGNGGFKLTSFNAVLTSLIILSFVRLILVSSLKP
jgi:hypothetical protein